MRVCVYVCVCVCVCVCAAVRHVQQTGSATLQPQRYLQILASRYIVADQS